jgi:hypothetical protein
LHQKREKLTPTQALRRSGRIPKEIAILLFGSDMQGRFLSEETKTIVLSRHGAGIVSTHKLSAEEELTLRRLDNGKETPIRLVGLIGSQTNTYTYGVAFPDPTIDFWGIGFPLPTESDPLASRFLLECSICKMRETVDHNEIESDVYAVSETILRHCKGCQRSTPWRRATRQSSVPLPPEPGKEA